MTNAFDNFLIDLGFTKYDTLFKVNQKLPYNLSQDVVRFPYWELDNRSWDKEIVDIFNQGKVKLNHKVCPICIVMDIDKVKELLKTSTKLTYTEYDQVESDFLNILSAESDAVVASGTLAPGFMLHIGVADGCAMYKVTKVTPKFVTIERRSHGDNYQDWFLGNGRRISRADFNRTHWGIP